MLDVLQINITTNVDVSKSLAILAMYKEIFDIYDLKHLKTI